MAPSAVETITTTEQREAPVLKLHSTQSGTGDYKQLQPHSFDKDAEEGKLEGFGGAKVRRNARNVTENTLAISARSQPTEHASPSLIGLVTHATRSTLLGAHPWS